MTKPRFQLECLEGRLTPTVSFFLVPPEVPSGAYSIGSYDSDQPDAAQPTVAILGLAEGDTPVFLAESADSTSSLLLASSASGFEATLYTINTSTAQAAVIGSSASISLLLADGSAVAFPVDQNFYSAGLDESGQLLIDVVNESFVTRFRIDPATGLAIDGDSETDGTQPDAILVPVTCELPPVDPFDQPEIIVDPVFVTELPTVSGIDGSETLVSLVTAGETTYGLAVNADADTATLYLLSTVDDVSTATAIAGVGSIALVLSDGSPVDFTANASDYSLQFNTESGAIEVSALSGLVQTQFRVDPSTGLAIDGDEEADGTQPDAVFVPATCELPPAEPFIDGSETLVSLVTAGETTYGLAVNADADTATLYLLSTVDDVSTATAIVGVGSIALVLSDGSPVDFTANSSDYVLELNTDSGAIVVSALSGLVQTQFRVDPSTGLAIDGDEEADGTQPDAVIVTELPTVSGIDGSETLVSLVTAGETTYGLAVNADADTATLYLLSTATAIAGVGSIALVLSDGSPVDFTANASDYSLEFNTESGAIVVSALSGLVQTQFRVDPSTGLAIDGDEEADGTQPDAVFVPVTCELPPAETDDQPEIIVDPVDPLSPQPVDQNYNYIPVQGWFNTIISGIDSSETLVSYTTDCESAYALAVNGDANTATLYQISTLDDVSTATAVGNIGSIALSLADGNSVEFSIYSGQYITEVDADGNLIVCEHNAGLLTTFRVDLTTGLAIDADVEADGTQPDSSLTVVQDVTPPPEWWDQPISIVMPPVPWLPAVGGIPDSEVLVSVVSTGDVTYGLAVDAAANVATLYLVSTVEDISTATAIGEFGSIALVNADGSVVVFTDYADDYVVEVDADGNIGVRAFNNNLQTSFRIDPSTGLAIDGDAGVEGTQPDSIEFVRRYERYVAYSSVTLVSVVTAGEVTYALAVNDDADKATLYLVSTVNDESTATAVGDIGSVALTFASGGAVELTANPSDYSLDVDADGNVVVRAFFGSMQRSFRIDPTSGLAIDGDAEAEGTQPDYVLAVCYSVGPPVALNDGEFEPEWAYRTNDDGDSTIDPRILYSTGSSNGGSESLSLNFFAFCDDTGSEPMLYASAQTSAPAPALTYSTTGGKVVMVTADGRTGSFTPFVGFAGSVHTATGDINGDRIMDVVVVPAVVGAPGHIRVLSGADGSSIASFICFPGYLGSIDIAVVDINSDGFDDIIASSTGGASGTVAIFNGRDFSVMKTFYPYGAGYMGTVHVSGYDPDGDGAYSILTSTGEGTRGHVKAFDPNLDVFLSFFSGAEGDLSGCYVIGGDLDGDGLDDIATGTGAGTEAEVHVFDGNTGSRRHSMKVFSGYMGGANLEMISSATNPLAMDLVVGSGDGARGTLNVIDGREFEVIDAYFAEGDAEESTEGIVF